MASSADWVLNLLDRVTRPAGVIDRALARTESRIRTVNTAAASLSSRLGMLALAGENSARRVSTAWNSVHRSFQSSQQGMQSLLGTMTAGAAVAAGVGYAGKKVLDAAGLREMQITQISYLLKEKDPEKVKASVRWINEFADTTPFTDNQTMKLVRQTMGYGFKEDQMRGIVRIVGDAANLSANDPEDAAFRSGAVIRALGQIQSKGKLMQQEVNQIAEHIPGITQWLDDALGGGDVRRKMQEKGQISSNKAISIILAGMNKDYGGGMDLQAQQLLGLASTLKSRPQRIMGMLTDNGSLEPVKRFFRNMINLTDNTKQPGKRLLDNMAATGKRMIGAIFSPLANATEGRQAEELVERLTKHLEEVTRWFERNGPRIRAETQGFGQGFKAAADGASLLLKPLEGIVGAVDRMNGGNGEGVLGKILGFGFGALILARLGNFLTGGLLGMAGKRIGTMMLGGIATAFAPGSFMRFALPALMRSVRGVGWMRALGLAGLGTQIATAVTAGGGLGAIAMTGLRAVPVIGWIITGITTLKLAGDALYKRFSGFADLIDGIREKMSWMLDPGSEQTTVFGRALHFDPIKMLMGEKQVWEKGDTSFGAEVSKVSERLGIKAEDLLAVMNFESGLDPSKRNPLPGSTATGLIQFTEDTARGLGTTTRALRRMTREEQLPFVERYLTERGIKPGMGLEQLYMSVLRGNPATGDLFVAGTEKYEKNKGLDVNGDGVITSKEATAMVTQRWAADAATVLPPLHIYLNGPVDQAGVDAIQSAVGSAWNNAASEGGR